MANGKNFEQKFVDQNIGLIDLVELYPSIKLEWEFLIQKCDTIMPRYYTIASSAIVNPDQIRIAISLTTFKTHDGRERLGLTSAFLKTASKAKIFVKNSNFEMRTDVPMLMVGPGTGVVPFIAFTEERQHLKIDSEAHLFFGCRDKDNDFIYRDFLASMVDNKVISSFQLAFSRPRDGQPKNYVQDVLARQVDLIERILRLEKGCLYICGATKMGADVQSLVKKVLGEDEFKTLQQEKRVIVELWSS